MRALLALILSLALAATGQVMASARGQVMAGLPVEICSVDGLITVTLDAEGRPTGPAHLCPDLVLGFFADAGLPFVAPDHAPVLSVQDIVTERKLSHPRPVPHPGARDPPASV
ncbi:MAG: hypothetical protein ACRCSU_08085 [Paracoccaceae bacterium]